MSRTAYLNYSKTLPASGPAQAPLTACYALARLSVQRLRTLQQKKEAQAKASRRDIATLLERGKVETARIKVEGLINEDVHVELLELLELYCELLLARFGLLDQRCELDSPAFTRCRYSSASDSVLGNQIQPSLKAFAASFTPLREPNLKVIVLPELHVLRDILMHKYGREFSARVMENRDSCMMRKLVVDQPSNVLVDGYLREIAKGYGVPWESDTADETAASTNEDTSTQEEDKSPDEKDQPLDEKGGGSLPSAPSSNVEKEDDFETLVKRFADLKKR
ncbi:hypothetical protein D9756_005821 [Leucocoprinus leucothites]|uniref:DUF292-domain-containing protein n=1 Tax=Leucocoprinus leucothites TaxID=201217 RepID=A0A8H5FXI4_9AGAR|nr:hypothetical protein D9756_005821 [Leucoagaricus leucothites]